MSFDISVNYNNKSISNSQWNQAIKEHGFDVFITGNFTPDIDKNDPFIITYRNLDFPIAEFDCYLLNDEDKKNQGKDKDYEFICWAHGDIEPFLSCVCLGAWAKVTGGSTNINGDDVSYEKVFGEAKRLEKSLDKIKMADFTQMHIDYNTPTKANHERPAYNSGPVRKIVCSLLWLVPVTLAFAALLMAILNFLTIQMTDVQKAEFQQRTSWFDYGFGILVWFYLVAKGKLPGTR